MCILPMIFCTIPITNHEFTSSGDNKSIIVLHQYRQSRHNERRSKSKRGREQRLRNSDRCRSSRHQLSTPEQNRREILFQLTIPQESGAWIMLSIAALLVQKFKATNIDKGATCHGKEWGTASSPLRIFCPGSFGEISGSPHTTSSLVVIIGVKNWCATTKKYDYPW